MTRLFLQEARLNLTAEAASDTPSKWTADELETLEKTLREHEAWLNEWVEKQKNVKMNEDPVILTTEMKARAKTLENQTVKLMRRKAPKPKKTSTTTSATGGTTTATATDSGTSTTTLPTEHATPGPHDEL